MNPRVADQGEQSSSATSGTKYAMKEVITGVARKTS